MDFIVQKFSYIIQIYKVYDVNQKFIESSINFNMIILDKKFKKFQKKFQRIFETQKQTCFNKKIQHKLKWKKKYYDQPTFKQYKKTPINLFTL